MPRGVCGLNVRLDLKSRTAGNYKQCGPPLFFSNCLSVDLSSVVRDGLIYRHVGLLWLLFTAAGG